MPLLQTRHEQSPSSRLLKLLFSSPIRLIVISFAVVILIGTVLLMLPISSQGAPTPFFMSLFTATSATCVTGLVMVDTASHFSSFGQGVILMMIQVGGLGLATITTFFFSILSKSRSWRLLSIERETTSADGSINPRELLSFIIRFTLILETIGAVIFIWRFWPYYGQGAIWRGIFQSVSAFCNAGFDLFGTKAAPFVSLTSLNGDPIILLTTAFLIIAGGLGFIVWREIFSKNKSRSHMFHVKLVLSMTAIALISGMLFFWIVEASNDHAGALGLLPAWQRPIAAFFQSVTTRTAGFNSINQSTLTESSRIVSSLLMFIGASPAGTGGGIKLTTFAVVMAVAMNGLKPEEKPRLGRHHLKRTVALRAVTIFFFALFLVVSATLLISIIEQHFRSSIDTSFVDNLFEVTSAFGTVGLTSVGTPKLHLTSQTILIILMFIGRVGSASFAISLMKREHKPEVVRPEGNVIVG